MSIPVPLHHDRLGASPGFGSTAVLPALHRDEWGANDTVFFAVQPPATTATSIVRLARDMREKHRLAGKPLQACCLHISLLFVGYYGRLPPEMLSAVIQAASTVAMPALLEK